MTASVFSTSCNITVSCVLVADTSSDIYIYISVITTNQCMLLQTLVNMSPFLHNC